VVTNATALALASVSLTAELQHLNFLCEMPSRIVFRIFQLAINYLDEVFFRIIATERGVILERSR
jgi:hypothetical protein